MRQTGIGIIGYGGFAEFCRGNWNELDGVRVVAASDVNPARDPGNLPFFTDHKKLLERHDVNLIAIGTPPSTHYALALEALKAGKHVLVEKPPSLTASEAEDLVREAGSAGTLVCVDYMLRYNPIVQSLREIGVSGILGNLQHVSIVNYAGDGQLVPEHWFWDKSISGGILVEHAVHFFDMVSYIHKARAVRVTGHATSRNEKMEDKVQATVEHEDGLVATHYHHFFRPNWFERQSFRFGFDIGEIDVEGWIPLTARLRALTTKDTREKLSSIFSGASVRALQAAESTVKAGGSAYFADEEISLEYTLPRPKQEVYGDCLKSAMADIHSCLNTPGQTPKIALENCLDSIRIAAAAREFGEAKKSVEL